MKDQFKLLKKENDLRTQCLNFENQQMLEKWIAYTMTSDISPYDFELCRKELIGIALQKELEGKDLEHFFTEEPRYIAENIIEGCKKKTFKDYLLFDLRTYSLNALLIYFLFDLLTGRLAHPASIYNCFVRVIYLLIMIPFQMLLTSMRIRTLIKYDALKPNGILKVSSFLVFAVFLVLAVLFFEPLDHIILPGFTHLHLIGFFGIAWMILTYYYRKYVHELITAKPWKD